MEYKFEAYIKIMSLENDIKHKFSSEKQKAMMNIIYTANWMNAKFTELLKPLDMSIQQLNILSIINGQKNQLANVNLVKERMIDRSPNISRLLNKLMEKGYIIKDRCIQDQRVVFVKITEAGLDINMKGREIISDFFDTIEMSEEKSKLVNEILEEMRY